jgi:hypothetical protein
LEISSEPLFAIPALALSLYTVTVKLFKTYVFGSSVTFIVIDSSLLVFSPSVTVTPIACDCFASKSIFSGFKTYKSPVSGTTPKVPSSFPLTIL